MLVVAREKTTGFACDRLCGVTKVSASATTSSKKYNISLNPHFVKHRCTSLHRRVNRGRLRRRQRLRSATLSPLLEDHFKQGGDMFQEKQISSTFLRPPNKRSQKSSFAKRKLALALANINSNYAEYRRKVSKIKLVSFEFYAVADGIK